MLVAVIEHRALPWFEERATFARAAELVRRRPDAFDIASLDRLAVLCAAAGYDDVAARARTEAEKRRRTAT
jgi:hypothetical protein